MKIYLPLQIAGITLICVAAAFIYLPAGIGLGGFGLTAFGIALERSSERAK